MKKIVSLILALLMVSLLSVGVLAEHNADVLDVSSGHYLVFKFNDPDAIVGTVFDWGYCNGLTKTDGAVLIPAGTGRGAEMSIMHVSDPRPTVFDTEEANCFVTSTLKYFAVTYKTTADGSMILKFAPSVDKWSNVEPAGWKAEDCFEAALPASGDYTTVVVALSTAVQYDDPLFLFSFVAGDVPADISIRNFGFFASEEEAAAYYAGGPVLTGHDPNVLDMATGRYTVFKFSEPDAIIGTVFDWGYCGSLTKADGAILIPAGTGREAEMSIMHVGDPRPGVFESGEANCFITATQKYFAVTYKTAANGSLILKFAPSVAKWGTDPAGWKAEDCFEAALPASGDEFKTVLVTLSDTVQYADPLFLFCFEAGDVPADILIRDFGFFASEEEARAYYNQPDLSTGGETVPTGHDPNVLDLSADHYLVFKFSDPDAIIGTVFNWGYCNTLSKTDGAILIPAGTGREAEMSIMHVNSVRPGVFETGEINSFITSKLNVFAITYKTAADGSVILKFAPSEDKWGNVEPAGWKAEDCFEASFPASGDDYKTVLVTLSDAVQYDDPLFLFCFEAGNVPADILIRDFGFFASEEEARAYYNLPEPTVGELVEIDGVKYYQENGVGVMAGLVKVEDEFYFAGWNGKIVTNKVQYIWENSTGEAAMSNKNFAFGADGKLLTGILNDVYYQNGVATMAGMIKVGDDYYFVGGGAKIIKNKVQYVWANTDDCAAFAGKNVAFGEDGKMIVSGILNGVYYENGAAKMVGLVKIGDDYYFAGGAGRIVKDKIQYIWANSTDNAALSETNQTFGADGKMVA